MRSVVISMLALLFLSGCGQTEKRTESMDQPLHYEGLPVKIGVQGDEGLPVDARIQTQQDLPVQLDMADGKSLPVELMMDEKQRLLVRVEGQDGRLLPVEVHTRDDMALKVQVAAEQGAALPVSFGLPEIPPAMLIILACAVGGIIAAGIFTGIAAMASSRAAKHARHIAEMVTGYKMPKKE